MARGCRQGFMGVYMPVKLIGTVILLLIVTIFCGFNLGEAYRCDVNLLFYTFKEVPVFFTVLLSFFAGMLVMFPFTIGNARRKAELKKIEEKEKEDKRIAKEQARAEVQAKKDAVHAEKEAKRQASLAEKERKEHEKLAKKNAKASENGAKTVNVNPANEVPVIATEQKPKAPAESPAPTPTEQK